MHFMSAVTAYSFWKWNSAPLLPRGLYESRASKDCGAFCSLDASDNGMKAGGDFPLMKTLWLNWIEVLVPIDDGHQY